MVPSKESREEVPELFETIRDAKKRAFLEVYAKCGIVRAAIRATGISRSSPYYWREHDPEFAEAMEVARGIARDNLSDEAFRRALEGEKTYKFRQDGKPLIDPETGEPYFVRAYSDRLVMFLLERLGFPGATAASVPSPTPESQPETGQADWYGT